MSRPGLAHATTEYRGLPLSVKRYKLYDATPAELLDDGHIDEIAVRRVLSGERCPITTRELVCVVYDAARRHMTDTEIAALLGDSVTANLVCRLRERNGIKSDLLYDPAYLARLVVEPSMRLLASPRALIQAGVIAA